ncbi:MAG: hypothetical protein JNM13_10485 [Hyphomicrobiaceae bacterium]|nr:hypothetical protein [Hyphomicrobiaceae bacterium]
MTKPDRKNATYIVRDLSDRGVAGGAFSTMKVPGLGTVRILDQKIYKAALKSAGEVMRASVVAARAVRGG